MFKSIVLFLKTTLVFIGDIPMPPLMSIKITIPIESSIGSLFKSYFSKIIFENKYLNMKYGKINPINNIRLKMIIGEFEIEANASFGLSKKENK
jgi:hypothetical protein